MLRTGNPQNDVERGQEERSEGIPWPIGAHSQQGEHPVSRANESGDLMTRLEGVNNRNDPTRSPKESLEQHQDFDDNANELWSLYGKEAKSHDEARIKTLKDDMDGVLIFAGLFSAVLTAFVVPKIQDLKVNLADQSVYYQNQTVQMLDRISHQLAPVGNQISTNLTPPLPYPTFHASASDRRVNIFWLISLICSLSAALLATLVQQWYRAYMSVLQQSRNPLKAARVQLYLFEGVERLPMVAEAVPGLIHVSLILFFWGLGDIILHIDRAVFVATVVPIAVCVCLYLYCVVAPIWNPQSPYQTPFSGVIGYLLRKLRRSPYYTRFRGKAVKPASMEGRQEQSAMEPTKDRMDRDVRAVRWLVDHINGSNATQSFVLAIPGSFNQEWGRNVWKGVVRVDQPTSIVDPQTQPHPIFPSPLGGTTVYNLCRCVRYFLGTYNYEGYSTETKERRRRMRVCIETVASLVCCTDVELSRFGDVGEVLSELGAKERTNDSLTIISNPLFTVRWTCLSLVAIRKMVDGNRIQELAKIALDGIAGFQTGYGSSDTVAFMAAQRIDNYLKKVWAPVVDLHVAFGPWNEDRTESEIREILNSHEESILELERIANEAVGMEDVDWRISLLQEMMDTATNKLTRRLPGVFFQELKPVSSTMISEAFDFSPVETTPVLPQLIFPGQQIQSLCTLGRRLRDIIEEQNIEMHDETLKSLAFLREIPLSLRRLNNPMKRQLWRLLDLRSGGLGFTIELFFLALRPLSSTSLSSKLKEDFYSGTFEAITSNWAESKKSVGTQRVLLDLLCDLVIRRRGIFSDFSYPPYIVDKLLDLVGKMVEGHGGSQPHINEVIQELDNVWNRMDKPLRDKALSFIRPSSNIASS